MAAALVEDRPARRSLGPGKVGRRARLAHAGRHCPERRRGRPAAPAPRGARGRRGPFDHTYNAQLNLRSSLESTGGDRRDHAPDGEQLPPFRFERHDLEDESALRFGFNARRQYGSAHPNWHADLVALLRQDWTTPSHLKGRAWDDVLPQIRYGYEFQGAFGTRAG